MGKIATAKVELSAAISLTERTRALLDGSIVPAGVSWRVTRVHPSEMFWRQLKFEEFDVSEMSVSSLLIMAASGQRNWVALPVFPERVFSHTLAQVRAGAGIGEPAQLAGKRVGVPEYQQTSAVWSRGILQHEFGVDLRSIEWFMERTPERSHGGSTGFEPPPGIKLTYIPPEQNIGTMLAGGALDATLLYISDRNLVDRSRADVGSGSGIVPLFADPEAEGHRYFAKTGILPFNSCVVVRRTVYERHPWIALNLFNALVAAKERALGGAVATIEPYFTAGLLAPEDREALRGDPFPYGVKASLPALRFFPRLLHEQGLTKRIVDVEEIFAKQALDL